MKAQWLRLAILTVLLAAPFAAQAQAAASTPSAISPQAEYLLGPSDKLRMIVFGDPSLTGEYVVSPAGNMSLPLIGDVKAQGRTVTELKIDIETKYRSGYLLQPNVSLEVLTFRPFFILGEVNKPGEYPFTADLTVAKAVATAGGYTYRANTKRVFIRHAGEDAAKPYPLDSSLPVAPGDEVRISERYF